MASHETIGLVNQKNTTRSMTVLMPRVNANPFTVASARMYSTIAARMLIDFEM